MFFFLRDAVLRLDAHDLSLVEKFDWPASVIDVEMCQMKGQKDVKFAWYFPFPVKRRNFFLAIAGRLS